MTGTPISEFARREIDAIERELMNVRAVPTGRPIQSALRARDLLSKLRLIQREGERQRGRALAQRIADGLCAVLGDTCLTHNEPYDPGHANHYSGSTLD